MPIPLESKIRGGSALAIVMLAITAWMSYRGVHDLVAASKQVAASHALIGELEATRADVKELESATRGYLLTEIPDLLADREASRNLVPTGILRLRARTQTEPPQREPLERLADLTEALAAWSDSLIDAHRHRGTWAAVAMVRTGRGRRLTAEIDATIDGMMEAETVLLTGLEKRVRTGVATALGVLLAMSVATMVTIGFGLVQILRDLKGRRATETAVRESEARLQAILDNTPAVVYLKDLEGRYTFANRALERLLGRRKDEIIGKTSYQLFPQEVADRLAERERGVLLSREALSFEETLPFEGGAHTFLSFHCAVRGPFGVPHAVCCVSSDVTELRKKEEESPRIEPLKRDAPTFSSTQRRPPQQEAA